MKKILFTLLAGLIGFISYGQTIFTDDIGEGEKLIEAYFTPMAESFGAGLNNGWYNTAKPHSLGGFDVTFTVNTVIIPKLAETFNIINGTPNNEFNNVFTSNDASASTIFGSKEKTKMTYKNSETGIETSFEMPGGLKTPAIPLPMIQAGIGLIKNTAIDVRYMPMLNVGNNINVNLFGVGLKHDLLQWIPAIGDAIPMSLSLQGGYTSLNTKLKVIGQEVSLETKATTINLVASKKLLMITGYAGIGYNSAATTFAADANFNLDGINFNETLEIGFESNKDLRTNIGLRLNMTIVTIQADYTFAEYPTATLGIGVSLR
ncbi:MAG: DUF6588 family protein [Bacteroidota bacterium]|nr:DUF6588 family protein [Bacteroidota bacterium]